MLIWSLLIIISIVLISFFLENNQKETSQLSINEIAEHTVLINQIPSVDPETKEDLVKNNMWVQILDEQGSEVFSFNTPESVPNHYTPGELVSDYLYPAKNDFQLSTWSNTVDNQNLTWVLGKPLTSNNPFQYWVNNLWILFIIMAGLVIAIFFGRQLGAPLLYIVSWIESLSKGKYEEPFYHRKYNIKQRWRNKAKYNTYKELNQALSRLTSTLKRNTEERELLDKTREEWMTGVSHDLRTPLSVIKGYTVLLSSDEHVWEQTEVRHFSKIMEERVEYMEQLIEDFNLTFQLKNDTIPIQLEQKDLVNVIKNVLEQLEKMPEAKNKVFSFETNKEQIFLDMDVKYVQRALENLIANSIKHNPPDTTIKIILHEALSHPRQICVLIEDDGAGMDQETIEHLFDRYYRGTSAISNNSGTGLGMTIARQIIIAHGGEIALNSKLHLGTQFKITFPIYRYAEKRRDEET